MYIHKYYIHNIYEYYIYVCQCVSKSFASTTYLLIHLHLQLPKSIAISLIPNPDPPKPPMGKVHTQTEASLYLEVDFRPRRFGRAKRKRKGNFQPTWGKIWMKRYPLWVWIEGHQKNQLTSHLTNLLVELSIIPLYSALWVYRGVLNNVNSLKF